MATTWCTHCDADPKAYANGLCQPCEKYRRKYDRLPPDDVLVKRQRRRDTQHDEAKIDNRSSGQELATIGEIGKLRATYMAEQGRHPIEGLLEACGKAAVNVAALEFVTSQRPSFLGVNRFGEEVVHPLTALYGEWLDRYGRLQKLALDANVDQQRLNLAEGNARVVFQAVRQALSEAGLNPAQEAAINESLARQFRAISA